MTPKAKKSAAKKAYPPGQHGPSKRRGKMSDYGKQLLEKQRLRLQYNIAEKQMLKAYEHATKMTGNTGDLFMQILESRLDAVLFRAGFARSLYAARQYVVHGHVLVNGKRLDKPSYKVQLSDVVSIKEKVRKIDAIQDALRGAGAPPYLEVSKSDYTVKVLYVPPREEIPVICEMPLVVEYYSR